MPSILVFRCANVSVFLVDPETKAEFEEMQRKSPLSQAGGSAGAAGLQNFDLAGFLAGSGKKS